MLLVAGALTILLIGATLADLWLRASAQDQQARRWLHALSLSTPALWPAGTVLRHPEMTHPGVCPYFSPGLATAP